MNKTLHIVSGTTVTNVMKQANLIGDFLEWQDFLHEGPIPKDFSLQQLSKVRSKFLYKQNYTPLEKAIHTFEHRDNILINHKNYKEVILWFEQDLYDQLQLLQILNWFESYLSADVKVSLILTDRHFAEYSFQEIIEAPLNKHSIKKRHFKLAKKAWSALSNTTPLSWFTLLNEETSSLPFLKSTVQRLLEEYPNTINGLSRTAHQALLSIAKGNKKQQDIFLESQKQEQHPFIADIIFWKILDDFLEHKLISKNFNGDISMTKLGKDVLEGKENWIAIKKIDHWIGGVHLNSDNLWCWNIQEKAIGKYYYSKALSTLMPIKQKPLSLLNK